MTAAAVTLVVATAHGGVSSAQTVRRTSIVPGSGPSVNWRVDESGAHREVALPPSAALLQAETLEDVKAALRPTASGSPGGQGNWSHAVTVPDLDGDGRRDVVLQRDNWPGNRFVAVRGRDGRHLWSYDVTIPEDSEDTYAEVSSLGGKAGGLLITSIAFHGSQGTDASWTSPFIQRFTVLERDGSVRWEREYRGAVNGTEAGMTIDGAPLVVGQAPIAGAGDDLVVSVLDIAETIAVGGGTARVEVIDGVTGDARVVAVTGDAATGSWPAVGVVGDLDGDKLGDIVTATSNDAGAQLVARRGVDGVPLWTKTVDGVPVLSIGPAGQTDDDKVADLLLYGFDFERWDDPVHVRLASGADGVVRWQRYSGGAGSVGDIGGDGRDDIVVLGLVDGRNFGLRYSAYTGSGKQLYSRSHTVAWPRRSMMAMASVETQIVGDVDKDGTVDFAHEIDMAGIAPAFEDHDRGVVRSATGLKAFEGPVGSPLLAPVNRRGTDLAQLRRADGGVAVTAQDGATGRTLWKRLVPIRDYRWGFAVGGDVTGDRRSEILVLAQTRKGTAAALVNGVTGAMLWRKTASG